MCPKSVAHRTWQNLLRTRNTWSLRRKPVVFVARQMMQVRSQRGNVEELWGNTIYYVLLYVKLILIYCYKIYYIIGVCFFIVFFRLCSFPFSFDGGVLFTAKAWQRCSAHHDHGLLQRIGCYPPGSLLGAINSTLPIEVSNNTTSINCNYLALRNVIQCLWQKQKDWVSVDPSMPLFVHQRGCSYIHQPMCLWIALSQKMHFSLSHRSRWRHGPDGLCTSTWRSCGLNRVGMETKTPSWKDMWHWVETSFSCI